MHLALDCYVIIPNWRVIKINEQLDLNQLAFFEEVFLWIILLVLCSKYLKMKILKKVKRKKFVGRENIPYLYIYKIHKISHLTK